MDLAFVSDSIYPYNKGGKEKRLFEISRRLVQRGHTVTIYTMRWWEGPTQRIEEGVQLRAISPLFKLYTSERRRSIGQAILFGLRSIAPLLQARHDVVEIDHIPYLQLFAGWLATRLSRTPLVATWHEVWGGNLWREYLGWWKGRAATIVEWCSARTPDRIISVSPLTTRRLHSALHVAPRKIVTIPNGIDPEAFMHSAETEKTYDLLFVGRLLAHKNADLVLQTVATLRDTYNLTTRCLIIGEGPERERLEKLRANLQLETQADFKGSLSTEEVQQAYQSAKIFILPSQREGFGIVALEANAAGLPVITIDAPDNAMQDLIQTGDNGFICRPTAEALAAQVVPLVKDPMALQKISRSSKEMVAEYTWDNITDQVEKLYYSLTSRT